MLSPLALLRAPLDNLRLGHRVSVQRQIPASPTAIFDLLVDPARHADIDGSGTVLAARSSRSGRRLGLGDSFGMDMHLGTSYSTRNVVVEFEEDRLIAWQTLAAAPYDKLIGGRVWRYELEPVGETGEETLVTETWDVTREALPTRLGVRLTMAERTRTAMERTLERIETLLTATGSEE